MPSNTERLLVRIEADVRGLRAGLTEAETATGTAARGITARLAGLTGAADVTIKRLLGFGAAVFAIRKVEQAFTSAFEAADQIAKSADRLGITTDALQELEHAAQQSGIGVELFRDSFQKFARVVAEGADGTGRAKAVLRELGVELTDGQGRLRATDDILADVADALLQVEDGADRVRIAQKLFGDQGVRMLGLLLEGSEGMRRLRDEARALGLVMDESLIRNAERTGDEVAIVARALDIQFKQALISAAPLVSSLAQELIAILPPLTDFTQKLLGIGQAGILNDMDELAEAMQTQAEWVETLRGDLAAANGEGGRPLIASLLFGAAEDGLERQLEEAEAKLDAMRAKMSELQARAKEFLQPTETGDAGDGGFGDLYDEDGDGSTESKTVALNALLDAMRQEAALAAQVGDEREILAALYRAEAAAQKDYAEGLRETAALTDAEREAVRALVEQKLAAEELNEKEAERVAALILSMQQENELLRLTGVEREVLTAIRRAEAAALDDYNAGLRETVELTEAERAAVEAAARAHYDLGTSQEAATETSETLGDALRDDVSGGILRLIDDYKNWKSVALDVLKSIIAETIRLISTQKQLGAGSNSVSGSPAGGGGIGQYLGIAAQLIGSIFGFADGGRPPVGRPSLVGERGPELFVPGGPGTIIPNHALGGGAISISQSFDFRGADAGVEARVRPMIERAKGETFQAVFAAINRGGSYAKIAGRRSGGR